MRIVLDTNVVASALLWGGTPEQLLEAAGEGTLELFTSEALITELVGILGRTKFAAKLRQRNLSAAEIVARYREIAETVEAAPLEEAALRDPDDAAVSVGFRSRPLVSYRIHPGKGLFSAMGLFSAAG